MASVEKVIEATQVPNVYVVRARKLMQTKAEDGHLNYVALTDTIVEVVDGYGQFMPVETQVTKNVVLKTGHPFVKSPLMPIFEVQSNNAPILGFEEGEPICYLVLTPLAKAAKYEEKVEEVDVTKGKQPEEPDTATPEEPIASV